MSLLVTLIADALVATLLVATIVTSVRLSRRITRLKADESAMRQTIGDLVVASATAERAITGLRAALDECDRGLTERLEAAGRSAIELAQQVEAGDRVVARIARIVTQAGGQDASQGKAQSPGQQARSEVHQEGRQQARRDAPRDVEADVPNEADARPPLAALRSAPAPLAVRRPVSTSERLDAALAAAQAISERALDRVRARAA